MGFDVLIMASKVYTGTSVISDGYIYIKSGRVVDFGESPVPEDYTYATLVLGGEGRIAAPGLAAYIDAPAYPIRGLRPGLADRVRFYRQLDEESLAAVSLPAVYEAHMAGVTTLVVESPSPSIAADLASRVGGYYLAAVPSCIEASEAQVRVGGEGCPVEGASLVVEDGRVKAGGRVVLGAYSALNYAAAWSRLPRIHEASLQLRRALGIPGGVIEKEARAEIVVYDARTPPGMLADLYDLSLDDVYRLGLRVESLIAGEEVLVDAGEHLRITMKHFNEVRRLATHSILSQR
ncbi:hypothetical protein [Stetteria hydrogenophila]